MSDEPKKLYRSTDDRWLAGVCGGLAKYFNVDPTLVRVIFIILALIGLGGVIIYLLLWVIIPPEPTAEEMAMMDDVIERELAEEKPAVAEEKPAVAEEKPAAAEEQAEPASEEEAE